MKKLVFIALISFLTIFCKSAYSQCAMCKSNVENSTKGKNKASAKALNGGILMMVALPYAAVTVIGFVWYTNRKKKRAN